jgi:hypothetical protein
MAVNFARILPRRPRPKALVAARARPLWDRKRSSFACHSKVAGWNWRWAQSQPILTVGRCEAKPVRKIVSFFRYLEMVRPPSTVARNTIGSKGTSFNFFAMTDCA